MKSSEFGVLTAYILIAPHLPAPLGWFFGLLSLWAGVSLYREGK